MILVLSNLKLPSHDNKDADFESTSISTDADAIRSGKDTSRNLFINKTEDNIESTTSSSDDTNSNEDVNHCEIKILQSQLDSSYIKEESQDTKNPLLKETLVINNTYTIDNEKSQNCKEKSISIEKTETHPRSCVDSPYWIVVLASLFYFFSQGVDGFFQSQTYTFALCGPLKLETYYAGYINFAFFGSYCVGRLFCIPISRKLHPSVIIISALTLCCLSSAFLSFFGGSSLEALLVGNAVMGLSISFQFPCGLTWLASEMPGGMKSIYTSFMFTGANCGWIVLPPLASTLFYVISPSAPFVTAFVCNLFHMMIFITMHKLSQRLKSFTPIDLNKPD